MDILKKIEEWSQKGYFIEHTIIVQTKNGYKKQVKKVYMSPMAYAVLKIAFHFLEGRRRETV